MMLVTHLGTSLKLPSRYKSGYYVREKPLPLPPQYCLAAQTNDLSRGVIFQHENATPHSSRQTKRWDIHPIGWAAEATLAKPKIPQ